jgi:hypothetical protein
LQGVFCPSRGLPSRAADRGTKKEKRQAVKLAAVVLCNFDFVARFFRRF